MNNDFLSVAKKALLNGNRLESLHTLIGNVSDDSVIQQLQELEIRHNNLTRKINAGTIEFEDVQLEENRISSSILTVINNLQKKTKREASLFPTKAKNKFDAKWLLIAGLVFILLGLAYFISSKKQAKKTPVNPCAGIICQNEGKCYNGKCKCPSGYEGTFCETKKAEEFKMVIEDAFTITGRGTVVTGKIASGEIRKGDPIKIVFNGKEFKTTCVGIEMFRNQLDAAKKGDNVGLLLRGVEKGKIKKGMVVRK